MPLLLHAVPLTKGWHGTHYWKTSQPEDLPEELEYLSYQEFEDRLNSLNKVARLTYPTLWPNVVVILLLFGVVAVATIGIMHTGTNLAIMGQGACFMLPVITVIWIKARSETKARARKKFKRQSQKLLRSWTAHDLETHAIQWKLRRRSMDVARRWLGGSIERTQDWTEETQRPDGTLYIDELGGASMHEIRQQENAGTTTLTLTQALQMDIQTHRSNDGMHDNGMRQGDGLDIPLDRPLDDSERDLETPPPLLVATPSPITTAYYALRISSRLRRTASRTSAQTSYEPALAEPPLQDSTLVPENLSLEPERSRRGTVRDRIRRFLCCGFIPRKQKVWLIEISLRECQLDEYALTVPSPVYCDYRLPGYEDTMASTGAGLRSSARAASVVASTSRLTVNRYQGEPPAYESESDDDSDGEIEDGAGASADGRTVHSIGVLGVPDGESGMSAQSIVHLLHGLHSAPNLATQVQHVQGQGQGQEQESQQRAIMTQQPFELTSVVVLSSESMSQADSAQALEAK